MKFPLGDIMRAIGGKLGWIFKFTKGTKISIGEHDILLNKGHGTTRVDPEPFNKPHQPGT